MKRKPREKDSEDDEEIISGERPKRKSTEKRFIVIPLADAKRRLLEHLGLSQ